MLSARPPITFRPIKKQPPPNLRHVTPGAVRTPHLAATHRTRLVSPELYQDYHFLPIKYHYQEVSILCRMFVVNTLQWESYEN